MRSRPRSGAPGQRALASPPLTPLFLPRLPAAARVLLLLALCLLPSAAIAQMAAAGQWLSADGEVRVDTFDCQGMLCGRVVWLRQPVDEAGRVRRDVANEEASLRDRPLLGLQVLSGFAPDGPDRWIGGVVYVPRMGRAYYADAALEDSGTLSVRRFLWYPWLGWVPGLSRTERWTRVGP